MYEHAAIDSLKYIFLYTTFELFLYISLFGLILLIIKLIRHFASLLGYRKILPLEIDLRGIFLGYLVCASGPYLVILALNTIVMVVAIIDGVETKNLFVNQQGVMGGEFVSYFSFFSSSVFTLLGGYVTGRIAEKRKLLNGAILGSFGELIVLIILLDYPPFFAAIPRWQLILDGILIIPIAVLGASFAARGANQLVITGNSFRAKGQEKTSKERSD